MINIVLRPILVKHSLIGTQTLRMLINFPINFNLEKVEISGLLYFLLTFVRGNRI